MEFRELSDEEWNFIKPFLPPKFRVGRPKLYNIEIYKKMRFAIKKFFGWIKYFRKIIYKI